VLLLERDESPHSPLKQLPFGLRGLNAPSIQALQRRGILFELQTPKRLRDPHMGAAGGEGRAVGHFAGIPLLAANIDAASWPFPFANEANRSLLAEMEELETVLARRAESLGVHIVRGIAVTDFQQSADAVTVVCGDRRFEGRWLVGCDGARSVVRKVGSFAFPGTEPEFTGYSVFVDLLDPEKLRGGRNMTATGMYLQSQPGYLVIQDFDGGAFQQAREPVSLSHIQEVLRRVSNTDVTVSALHLATTWTDRARQVTKYRSGRVLLAGDAAHIHSPLGGQGLNLGLGDAANLGWKLAATVQGQAANGLLDSYSTERHSVAAAVLDWSRAQVAIMRPDSGARALRGIMQDLLATRDGATYVAGRIWGIASMAGDGGLERQLSAGHEDPDFPFQDGTCGRELIQDDDAWFVREETV
ncbi:MAG: FAD-dependent monooxygenase, partial [Rhodospirillales bacterium]|nr:FAD-dependent monooxygenase [Acetobacter sp.]